MNNLKEYLFFYESMSREVQQRWKNYDHRQLDFDQLCKDYELPVPRTEEEEIIYDAMQEIFEDFLGAILEVKEVIDAFN